MLHPLQPLGIAAELKAALEIQRQVLAWALTPSQPLTEAEIRRQFAAPWADWLAGRFMLKGGNNDFVRETEVVRVCAKKAGAKRRILRAFEHDITFDALSDPAFTFHYHTKLSEAEREALQPLMAGFYDWLCSPGLPRLGGGVLTRDALIADYCTANPDVVVCPSCDGRRSDAIGEKVFADCDHYLPKSLYPFVAIHPANLLPTKAPLRQ